VIALPPKGVGDDVGVLAVILLLEFHEEAFPPTPEERGERGVGEARFAPVIRDMSGIEDRVSREDSDSTADARLSTSIDQRRSGKEQWK